MTPPLYPLPEPLRLNRRSFVAGSASFALAVLCATRGFGAILRLPKFSAYPFQLGVASGDPTPDGVVLWTRLAPQPLDGGGLPAEPIEVSWQVAEDEGMTRIVRSGVAVADPAWAHSVHVEVEGLRPDRWYWYWFKAGHETSPKGRTRTMPAADVLADRLRFAFASCQKYDSGYYTAYEHMTREDLDLVVHLGDYIYEKAGGPKSVRPNPLAEAITLEGYRQRYALYKTDPALQAAHAMAPWIVTWDDHEVSNNYANDIPQHPERTTTREFMLRRAAAYQAYYEHMPLRRSAQPHGPDLLLYRRLEYGQLASFHVLDTRQYRTDQPQGDGTKPPSPVLMDPRGTLMGARQRQWLYDGLDRSPAAWNAIAQQILMARVDLVPGPDIGFSMDKWSGYEFERRSLLRHLHDHKTVNPVVLSGDFHRNFANNLIVDFDDLDSAVVASEFLGTSISSDGDGEDRPKKTDALLAENPFVKFFNGERGYVRCEVTPKTWRSDFRTVPYVSRRGAPLLTRASFIVESGRPELQRA